MRVSWKLLAALSIAVLAVVFAVWFTPPAPTAAGAARIGTTYRYSLYTHCGVNLAPIEFDGSEWRIELVSGEPDPPPGFGNAVDEGTVTLTSDDAGVYRSSEGVERPIVRQGPIVPKPSDYLTPCI